MYDFPIWFDHVQMALFRVFVTIEREIAFDCDENGDVNWFINTESNDCGIFLSMSMAKTHYNNISIFDFISQKEIDSHQIFRITKRFEMWTIDECNKAQFGKIIEEKEIF